MGRNTDLGWAWKQFDPIWKAANRVQRKGKRKGRKRGLLHAKGADFYDSKPWLKMRIKVFATYGRKCMKCDRRDGEMHVDHVIPRSKRPELSLTFSNLQVLCRHCNLEKMNYNSNDYREDSVSRDLDLLVLADVPARF